MGVKRRNAGTDLFVPLTTRNACAYNHHACRNRVATMGGLKCLAGIFAAVIVMALLWYQAFAVTGVMDPVVPPGVARPGPPVPPELPPLPLEQANIDLFSQSHPVWSAL